MKLMVNLQDHNYKRTARTIFFHIHLLSADREAAVLLRLLIINLTKNGFIYLFII